MNFHLNITPGEFFDGIRPAGLVLAAFVSAGVLASARKRGFPLYAAVAWALGSLFFPLVVVPLYLAALLWLTARRRSVRPIDGASAPAGSSPRWRITIPLVYLMLVIALIVLNLYRDSRSVDAHLARAVQARVGGARPLAIREYQAALVLEDNPHTRKLLAIQLADAGELTEALNQFRLAEKGGEPDPTIPYRIANLLDSLDRPEEAASEYRRFLSSSACAQGPPQFYCATAANRLEALQKKGDKKDRPRT